MSNKKIKIDLQKLKYNSFEVVHLNFKNRNDNYKKDRDYTLWVDINNIKPVDLYCYLQARFGEPNGILSQVKSSSSDNLIHWDYDFEYEGYNISIMCMTYRIEIHKSINFDDQKYAKDEFIKDIKDDFKNYGREISEFRKRIEAWNIFINPFKRLKNAVENQLDSLQKIGIDNFKLPVFSKKSNSFTKQMEIAGNKFSEAATLGLNIRLLLPVYAESFINFIIFNMANTDLKNDDKKYQSVIRKSINIRVKELHLNCIGFHMPVDYDNNESCKKFHSIMNIRNELLHGNVNPNTNKFDTIYFDKNTPLFTIFTDLALDSYVASLKGIEYNKLLEDYQSIQNFISYILSCLDYTQAIELKKILNESYPGWNNKTKRLGVLFDDKAVDFFLKFDSKLKVIS